MKMNVGKITNRKRFDECEVLTSEKIKKELDSVIEKIDANMQRFQDAFPMPASKEGKYPLEPNTNDWTQGFWTGMLWLAYEYTKNEKYKAAAEKQLPSYIERIEKELGVDHHDMGFLYSLSCVAAHKLTGSESAKKAAIAAADKLLTRYHDKGEFIQAWGDVDDPEDYRMIIDCLLNIPLLYWASEVTGNPKYEEIGYKHYCTTVKNIVRDDGTTYHTFYFDVNTGEPVKGVTAQGYSDSSCWARGQAWGVYGSVLTHMYRNNPEAVTFFKTVTNCFLNKLPEDYVAYWDMIFTDGEEERDSSAAAIAVCGLIAGADMLTEEDADKEVYANAAKHILNSLIDNYSARNSEAEGLLLHGVYNKKSKLGVDECMIWGDYFYMEALMRMYNPDWKAYW